jgi:hypothetical protein
LTFFNNCGRNYRQILTTDDEEEDDAIVTHNVRHLVGVEQYRVRVLTPRESLIDRALEAIPDVDPEEQDRTLP